jgi:hypothetical protein
MGDPTTYATAGVALRVSGALKPHHQDEVETPSVGSCLVLHLGNMKVKNVNKNIAVTQNPYSAINLMTISFESLELDTILYGDRL